MILWASRVIVSKQDFYEENLCASGVWPYCDIIYCMIWTSLSLSLSSFWILSIFNGRVIEQISGGRL